MTEKAVFLDIGHGEDTWERTGGKGRYYGDGKVFEEHFANADVALRLKPILEDHGLLVFLPQPAYEKEVPLQERTDFANQKAKDFGYENTIYWSVHFNANADSSVTGVCAFYWHTSDSAKRLADCFVEQMKKSGFSLHGDGLHASKPDSWTNLHVCRETVMTAVLTENGFFTNDATLEKILQPSYRQKIAEAHAKAILDYFGICYTGDKKVIDTQDYRLLTGTWTTAEGLVNAKKRLRDAGYGMLLYEVAEREGNTDWRIIEPKYRLLTGTYNSKESAEKVAEELRQRFGWLIYIVPA